MTTDKDENVEVYPAVEPTADKAYRLAEAATSLIPAGQSILHSLVSSPIQKRMEIWIEQTEERIKILENEGRLDFSELENRPEFSALLLRTIQAAAITSQQEQLDNLQNFILNASLVPDLSEDELFIILTIISEFTPSHARVLRFYSSPELYTGEIILLRQRINQRSIQNLPGNPQGLELSSVFGGDPNYWLNIFNLVSGKGLIVNHTTPIEPSSPDIIVHGKATEFGKKVMSMLQEIN